ncbi:heparan-alpha-glucosaminide N-acetyltransferase domain-containing protein [uncultured Paludibaculum sp.]|uniref:acyltransferase family protein n=1 Tax=uncultured Paludibaculum sp. TaxID=1765020 RepID=UPI002AABBED5|nr:heparan-alpha-glucosaminide N-acetyltransferase domain-containing protein [uncultured Paludibaculum sp.]
MSTAPRGRLQALDLFRGATIASMILVNNPGSSPTYTPLEHAEWHGWTFTDTVFPFFLWIVGVAMTLSTARRIEQGEDRVRLLRHTVQRAVIIFLIGFLLGPFPNIHFATIRIPGVLQRIAVCYLIAGIIFLFTKVRGQIAWLVGLNVLYWGLMTLYPTPGCGPGSLTKDCNFARYIDTQLLTGHMWRATKVWDPEGVISTLPAIGTVLFGILTGHLLRRFTDPQRRLRLLFGAGAALLILAHVLAIWMPFNKNLWTTSYSVLMAGLASCLFGAWYWISDLRGWGRWFRPFEIFGSNAILMFVLSGTVAKIAARSGAGAWFYQNVCLAIASQINASLLYAIANVLVLYLIAWALWRKRWFLKF